MVNNKEISVKEIWKTYEDKCTEYKNKLPKSVGNIVNLNAASTSKEFRLKAENDDFKLFMRRSKTARDVGKKYISIMLSIF